MVKKKSKKEGEKIFCDACNKTMLKSSLKRHIDTKTHISNANKKNLNPRSGYHSISDSTSTVAQIKSMTKQTAFENRTSSIDFVTRISSLEKRMYRLERLVNTILPRQKSRIKLSKPWITQVINKLNTISDQKYLTFFQLRSSISKEYNYDKNELNEILQELVEQKIITLSKGSKSNNLDK